MMQPDRDYKNGSQRDRETASAVFADRKTRKKHKANSHNGGESPTINDTSAAKLNKSNISPTDSDSQIGIEQYVP
jgi:hypothetical protein